MTEDKYILNCRGKKIELSSNMVLRIPYLKEIWEDNFGLLFVDYRADDIHEMLDFVIGDNEMQIIPSTKLKGIMKFFMIDYEKILEVSIPKKQEIKKTKEEKAEEEFFERSKVRAKQNMVIDRFLKFIDNNRFDTIYDIYNRLNYDHIYHNDFQHMKSIYASILSILQDNSNNNDRKIKLNDNIKSNITHLICKLFNLKQLEYFENTI